MKNRIFVMLIICIICLTYLTSCKSTKTQVNTGDKPTAENQGRGQVVNSNIEKSESNTYDSIDEDISRSSNFVQEGNWIYFGIHSGNDTGWNIYRQSLDGKNNKSLLASKTRGFCISGSLILYVDFLTGGIYKINKDGTGKTNVLENGAGSFIVSKDWIYYINIDEHGHIYKVSMDGTKRIKITEDESWNFDVTHGDWIYYTKTKVLMISIRYSESAWMAERNLR